jgi:hypothetical protein
MKRRMQVALALAAAGLAAGGGVAVAQGRADDPAAEREAFLEDAAGRLGVEPGELESALEEAAVARLDEAVESGRLSEEQAKEQIRSGEAGLPGLGLRGGPPGHHGFAHGPGFLEPAADYLGLDEDTLRERLAAGDSLAEIAEAEGKDADGLVDALVADARARLDQAVEDGRLDEAELDDIVERIRDRTSAPCGASFQAGSRTGPGTNGSPTPERVAHDQYPSVTW